MCDLNHSIEQWRQSLQGLAAEQADELEDHLRAECDLLANSGLTAQEQVLVASRRLGATHELEAAFVSTSTSPRRWCRGWLVWPILWTLVVWGVYRIGFFIPMPGMDQARMAEWITEGGLFPYPWLTYQSHFHSPLPGLLLVLWGFGLLWIQYRHLKNMECNHG